MSHGGKSQNGFLTTSNLHVGHKIFQSYGSHRKELTMLHGGKSIKWIPLKSSCGTQNEISNPMGIALGIDYVTWRKILKWIPRTSNLHVGHKIKFPILWV